MTERPTPKYPDALSRDMTEGGYTFLHRVFRQNIDSGKPVILNTDDLYFQYNYSPKDTSFKDGLKLIDGSNSDTEERFYSVVNDFGLELAISEGGYSKDDEGNLNKKSGGVADFLKGIRKMFSKKA